MLQYKLVAANATTRGDKSFTLIYLNKKIIVQASRLDYFYKKPKANITARLLTSY